MNRGFLASSAFTACFIIVMLVVQMLLLAWNLYAGNRNPMPVLHIIGSDFDGGVCAPGEIVEIKVPLLNLGNKRLIVREESLACEKCSDRLPISVVIAPYSKHELPLQFQAPRSMGWVKQSFSFLTNDPMSPRLTLTLKATISDTGPLSD